MWAMAVTTVVIDHPKVRALKGYAHYWVSGDVRDVRDGRSIIEKL